MADEEVCSFSANDGVNLKYYVRGGGVASQPLVLIHGWSGSHRYFDNSVEALSQHFKVYALDLRHHGDSEKPGWGFHVARLAADLHDFLEVTKLTKPTIIGTSLGCAVIWSYVELYGCGSLSRLVFVDQAPSQWRLPDWSHGSKGIYDAASLANIQRALLDMDAFAEGNAQCCLTLPLPAPLFATLKSETLKCSAEALGKIMADHAPKDWRDVLPRITVPCLNLYGTNSGCFPVEGTAAVGTLIPRCKSIAFEGCNHWLQLEAPDKFVRAVVEFQFGNEPA